MLAAESPLLAAQNVVDLTPEHITWTTVTTYRNVVGRVVWAFALPIHRLTIPYLLRRAS